MATNLSPKQLNYDRYATRKYDEDIRRSIPGHDVMHETIRRAVRREFGGKRPRILELGIGTGLTAAAILEEVPKAEYRGMDFSENMLMGARIRLGEKVKLVLGDYATVPFPQENDIVVSVIGIHHQKTDEDKKALFRKISSSLKDGGIFIFGDLVTYRDGQEAALNEAMHYHFLVENAQDEQSLKEWAFHHKFLNCLAPLEDQMDWLREAGFGEARLEFRKHNTALIVAKK